MLALIDARRYRDDGRVGKFGPHHRNRRSAVNQSLRALGDDPMDLFRIEPVRANDPTVKPGMLQLTQPGQLIAPDDTM